MPRRPPSWLRHGCAAATPPPHATTASSFDCGWARPSCRVAACYANAASWGRLPRRGVDAHILPRADCPRSSSSACRFARAPGDSPWRAKPFSARGASCEPWPPPACAWGDDFVKPPPRASPLVRSPRVVPAWWSCCSAAEHRHSCRSSRPDAWIGLGAGAGTRLCRPASCAAFEAIPPRSHGLSVV